MINIILIRHHFNKIKRDDVLWKMLFSWQKLSWNYIIESFSFSFSKNDMFNLRKPEVIHRHTESVWVLRTAVISDGLFTNCPPSNPDCMAEKPLSATRLQYPASGRFLIGRYMSTESQNAPYRRQKTEEWDEENSPHYFLLAV